MRGDDTLIRRARPWLGTIVEIGVAPNHEAAIEAGFAEIARIHRLMSFHETTSDLAKLRAALAGEAVKVDRDTVAVLRIAADLHRATSGLFNIAIGRRLIRTHFLPRMDSAHLSHFSGTANDIEIVADNQVRLHRRTLIDFGGIAKGYAVDCAVAALEAAGVDQGIVNAGGDLRLFGDAPLPINVRMAQGGYSTDFAAQNCAIASSENVRTRRTIAGQVATPHIGPDNRSIIADQTVTVCAGTCTIADAMTKVAMIDAALANQVLADHGGHVIHHAMREAA